MVNYKTLFILVLAFLASNGRSEAQLPNLADITGINIDIPNGRVTIGRPEDPGRVIERTGQAIVGAPAKQFILSAKANAGPGSAVPSAVYSALLRLGVRRDLLDRARWSTNWGAVDNVFNADANAITLQELIVFRNRSDVFNNLPLWVHELKHFEQFDRLGLDAFASEYTVNGWVYENEATDAENRASDILRTQFVNTPTSQPQPPNMSTYHSYCATPFGRSPVITGGLPHGAVCSMPSPAGPVWGTVVGFFR